MPRELKKSVVWFSSLAVAGLLLAWLLTALRPVTTVRADLKRADFALLDQEPTAGDKSVQCGATGPVPDGFVIHITMTNRGDLGGADGFVRTKYHDGDFVDYSIPVNTTVQISLVGGGTPGVDDGVQVTNGGSGARLVGQASILAQGGSIPLSAISATSFCTTTSSSGLPPFGLP